MIRIFKHVFECAHLPFLKSVIVELNSLPVNCILHVSLRVSGTWIILVSKTLVFSKYKCQELF